MKKALSIIMALCMILSICSFSISAAPEGTAIKTEAEFLAMDPAGTYYLANDITITKSFATPFTGTFDGNGKTVTVSEPMFLEFQGTAKNLTLNGEILADHAKDNGYWARGAFACVANGAGTVVFENIVNNAKVTTFTEYDKTAYPDLKSLAYAGGIVGAVDNHSFGTTCSVAFTNCVNNGAVKGYVATGGITGICYINDSDYSGEQTVTITDCVNNGQVDGLTAYTGGIVGRIYYVVDATVTGCTNTGAIKGLGNTGGIVGHTTNSSLIMRFCQNSGFISNYSADGETPYAGGLLGYGQGTKSDKFAAADGKYANIIEYCINTGDVTGDCRSGGISGSTGADGAYGISHTRYCINTGNITNKGLGTSAAANAAGGIQGYGYGSGTKEYAFITNCINTGNVESKGVDKGVASYFLGYISSKYAVVKDNIALGTLTSAAGNTYALCWDNAAEFAPENITGNSLPAGNTYAHTYENKIVDKVYEVGTTDEAALASGQIIYEINQAYKAATGATEDVFFMTAGTFAPTLIAAEDGSNAIVKNADGTYGNPVKEPETAKPEDTKPADPVPTGDSAIIFAVVALISVLGVATLAKRREN